MFIFQCTQEMQRIQETHRELRWYQHPLMIYFIIICLFYYFYLWNIYIHKSSWERALIKGQNDKFSPVCLEYAKDVCIWIKKGWTSRIGERTNVWNRLAWKQQAFWPGEGGKIWPQMWQKWQNLRHDI